MALRRNLETMLQRGQDSPLLRFSLGSECLKEGDVVAGIGHLREALEQNPSSSAAWKLLGEAYTRSGARDRAAEVYRKGIETAMANGDVQAAKEMGVFLRRIQKHSNGGGGA